MDPKDLTVGEWQQVVASVNQFWLFALLVILAALSFGLAHGIIPSLLTTRQLPMGAARLRPILYVVSAAAIVTAVFSSYRALTLAFSLLRGVYPRWWI